MKSKLPFLVFFFGTLYMSSKNDNQDRFLKEDLHSFSKIQKYKLDHPLDLKMLMHKMSKKITLPEQRINQIMKSQYAGNTLKLRPEERIQLSRFKMILQSEQDKYQIRFCYKI